MIIDGSYFVNDIYLPQVGRDASTVANNRENLDGFIYDREPEILEMGLGSSLYNEFNGQFTDAEKLREDADQKWKDLLNGKQYVNGNIEYNWRGLIYERAGRPMSLIAYYVYYWYVKDGVTHTSNLGVVKPEAKNARPADPTHKLTDAWRKFHAMYGGYDGFRNYFRGYVKGVWYEDYFTGTNNTRDVSLYEFLSHNQDAYPNWVFTPIENKTAWGI